MPRPETDRKYDDASWHAGGDFPADVPYSHGGVHIAIFLAWVIRRGLYNPELFEPADVEIVQQQSISILGLLDRFDEKLVTEELSDEGNGFATYYYGLPQEGVVPPYLHDYERTLGAGLPSLYHVAPTWVNYEKIEPVIDERHREWVARGRPRSAGRQPRSRGSEQAAEYHRLDRGYRSIRPWRANRVGMVPRAAASLGSGRGVVAGPEPA